MNQSRRKSRQRRGPEQTARAKPLDLWQPRPELPPLEPLITTPDPTALLRSLGHPPLHTDKAEHYLAAVVARASVLATALAGSAGMLAPSDEV